MSYRNTGSVIFGVTSSASERSFHLGQYRGLKDKGWDIHSFSDGLLTGAEWGQRLGIVHHSVPIRRNPHPVSDVQVLVRLILLYARLRPAATVVGTPKAGVLGMAAAWLTRVPCRVYVVHGLRYQSYGGAKRWFFSALEKLVCMLATRAIAVSPSVKDELTSLGVAESKLRVIGAGSVKGVDPARFAPKFYSSACVDAVNQAGSKKQVLFLGRVTEDKGVSMFINTLEKLRESDRGWFGLVAGPFEGGQALRSELCSAEEAGILKYVGVTSDPAQLLNDSTVLLLPTKREGLGQVLIEAAMCGVPSVATNVIGCIDAVRPGVSGVLVESENSEVWADAVRNAELLRKLGGEMRAWAISNFRAETVNRMWVDYLDRCFRGLVD